MQSSNPGRRQKNDSAFALIRQLVPLARSIWGPHVQLTLHGSRAKNTFIDDSDFDYHIESTPRPITLDEMYDFLERCRQIPGVSPIPKIKMALSLVYQVGGLEDNSIQVELAPEKADYIDDETTIEPLTEKANTYFFENPTATWFCKTLVGYVSTFNTSHVLYMSVYYI